MRFVRESNAMPKTTPKPPATLASTPLAGRGKAKRRKATTPKALTAPERDPDLDMTAERLAKNTFGDAGAREWLNAENSIFGWKKPQELVNTDQEELVCEVLRAYRQGGMS